MNDSISREAALKLFATHDGNYLYEAIRDMPSAQPDVTDTNVGDTISRQAVLQRLTDIAYNSCKTEGQAQVIDWAKTLVCVMPSAQPERKKGKWIERNPQNSDKCRLIECDKCGFSHIVGFNVPYEHWIENRNFCERCGADMRCEDDDIPIEYFESGGKRRTDDQT